MGLLLALALSGWGLYYLGDEAWRRAALQAHTWIGLATPLAVGWHLWTAKRAR